MLFQGQWPAGMSGRIAKAARMFTLRELAAHVQGEVSGDAELRIPSVSGLENVEAGGLTFVEDPERILEAEASPAAAVIAPPGVTSNKLAVLQVAKPRVAFAKLLAHFHPRPAVIPGIHPGAHVDPSARIAPSARIGPFCSVGPNVEIGDSCELVARVTLEEGVRLDRGVCLQAGVVIGKGSKLGPDCSLLPHSVVGPGCTLGAEVETGARAIIGADVSIGDGTKLDNLTHVGEGSRLGRHVLMVGHSLVLQGCKLGDYSVVAAQSVVKPGVELGAQVQLAARSVADQPLLKPGTYSGEPAINHRQDLVLKAMQGKAIELWLGVRKAASSRRAGSSPGSH